MMATRSRKVVVTTVPDGIRIAPPVRRRYQTHKVVMLMMTGESFLARGDPDWDRLSPSRNALGVLSGEGWRILDTVGVAGDWNVMTFVLEFIK